RIRKRRKELGLTQASLAGSDLTKSFVSQIEQGRVWPSLPTLLQLAERLQLRAADLLLTPKDEAARLEAWSGFLVAVTSPEVPPKAKAQLLTALIPFATAEGLPLPEDGI